MKLATYLLWVDEEAPTVYDLSFEAKNEGNLLTLDAFREMIEFYEGQMAMSVYYEGPLLVEEDYDLISSFQELSDYKTPTVGWDLMFPDTCKQFER